MQKEYVDTVNTAVDSLNKAKAQLTNNAEICGRITKIQEKMNQTIQNN